MSHVFAQIPKSKLINVTRTENGYTFGDECLPQEIQEKIISDMNNNILDRTYLKLSQTIKCREVNTWEKGLKIEENGNIVTLIETGGSNNKTTEARIIRTIAINDPILYVIHNGEKQYIKRNQIRSDENIEILFVNREGVGIATIFNHDIDTRTTLIRANIYNKGGCEEIYNQTVVTTRYEIYEREKLENISTIIRVIIAGETKNAIIAINANDRKHVQNHLRDINNNITLRLAIDKFVCSIPKGLIINSNLDKNGIIKFNQTSVKIPSKYTYKSMSDLDIYRDVINLVIPTSLARDKRLINPT